MADLDNIPFPITARDREILASRDEDFHRYTWEDLQHVIATNTLETLKRVPSDLRRYLAWSHTIKQQYGNITSFVIQERLGWTPETTNPPTFAHHSATPFADSRDYAVLINDWPYGLAPGIRHLCVWSKTPIETDAATGGQGDVTPSSRRTIEEFVARFFVASLDAEGLEGGKQVLWFKNWTSLQSVRGVDHVHVLVRDVPDALLERWLVRRDQQERAA